MARTTTECRIDNADSTWRTPALVAARRPIHDVVAARSKADHHSERSVQPASTPRRAESSNSQRQLLTVLFFDIVGSTQTALRLGDRAWCDLLVQFHGAARDVIRAGGGRLVSIAGDGFLAVFDTPSMAVSSATLMRVATGELGMMARAGIHTAEVEVLHSGDVVGIGIHVGARVSQAAHEDEVWVSRTVRDLLVGSDVALVERGHHCLPGLGDNWELFAVVA